MWILLERKKKPKYSIVDVTSSYLGDSSPTDLSENSILKHGQEFSQHFANGLADNWSQVRISLLVC